MEIDHENRSVDDEIEKIFVLWRNNLPNKLTDRELKQHADTLVNDITQYLFDFSSDAGKFERYGQEFLRIMKSKSDDAIIKHVDLYWIHEQLAPSVGNEKHSYNLIIEASTNTADAGCNENVLVEEYQAARYLLTNLNSLDGLVIHRVLSDVKFRNIRKFINAGLKHEKYNLTSEFDNISSFFEETEHVLPLHKCIEENEVFLIDFFVTKILTKLSEKRLRKILTQKDANDSNIFQLACQKRIKFLIEDIWTLAVKAFETCPEDIEKFLLNKNCDDKNAFILAFQMPLTYTRFDYANEIKSRNALMNYYRDPGLLELEMYNFESCLNFVLDIARKNIADKIKKSLIVGKSVKAVRSYDRYIYEKEYSDFRCDFLQLRFYCITKLSAIKADNVQSVMRVYNFLSHYVDQYLFTNCNTEVEIMSIFQKLSFDGYLRDFFKIFVHSNFCQALAKIKTLDYLQQLIEISKKTLNPNEYHQVITQCGFNGNNALQMAISMDNVEMFRAIWSSFEYSPKSVINWILTKNNDSVNSLYMVIYNHQIEILQPMLEFFSQQLDESEILNVFENSAKTNYKFLDIAILFYNQPVFTLLTDFIQNHLSNENQKKCLSSNIISLAVSKWQESALVETLKFIEALYDENEIKELLLSTNWEGQTSFHAASKNSNLSQLQALCKFARYYLSEDDFVRIVTTKDMNDYSIVNDSATQADVYENLPNLSNFSTNFSAYVWIPLVGDEIYIPNEALKIGVNANGEKIYLARQSGNEDEDAIEVVGVTRKSQFKDEEYVDILAGHGLEWLPKDTENITPMKIESSRKTFYIGRNGNDVKLVSDHCDETFADLLCTNDQILHETNTNKFIFKRSF